MLHLFSVKLGMKGMLNPIRPVVTTSPSYVGNALHTKRQNTATNMLITVLVLLIFSCLHGNVLAQTIRGKVMDRNTEFGLASASILLMDESGSVKKMALSGPDGSYTIEAPEPGAYTLRVDAAGYNTHNEMPFTAFAGRVLELNIRLWSLTELSPVVVTAEEEPFAPGPLEGFHLRRQQGRGNFLTREDIEVRGAVNFTGLLRNVPSVEVIRMRTSGRSTIRFKGRVRAGRDCPPLLWVDNMKWGAIDGDQGPDPELFPPEIEGIEIYTPANVPPDFSGIGDDCGVIVVWTRRGP